MEPHYKHWQQAPLHYIWSQQAQQVLPLRGRQARRLLEGGHHWKQVLGHQTMSWSCRSWRRWGRSQGGRACLTTTTSSLTTSGRDSYSSTRKRSRTRVCVYSASMYLKEISDQRTCFSGRSATTLPSTTSSPRKSALAELYLGDIAWLTSQLYKPIQI